MLSVARPGMAAMSPGYFSNGSEIQGIDAVGADLCFSSNPP